jgi:hypothetical protein
METMVGTHLVSLQTKRLANMENFMHSLMLSCRSCRLGEPKILSLTMARKFQHID